MYAGHEAHNSRVRDAEASHYVRYGIAVLHSTYLAMAKLIVLLRKYSERQTHLPGCAILPCNTHADHVGACRVKTPRAEEGIVAVDVHEAGVVLGEHELTFLTRCACRHASNAKEQTERVCFPRE